QCYRIHIDQHSFPTRRSSDLWQRDKKGELAYTSLMHLLKDYEMKNEEIWDILSFRGSIYFRSFGAIYKYNHEKIIPLKNLVVNRSEEHTSELQSRENLVCRLL